jgi:pimeloyl-ACP methyl ester carboxylesterase
LLEELHLPALIIHGSSDPLIPVGAGRATAKAIPGAKYIEIPGMGHDLPRQMYGRFSDALAELAGRT